MHYPSSQAMQQANKGSNSHGFKWLTLERVQMRSFYLIYESSLLAYVIINNGIVVSISIRIGSEYKQQNRDYKQWNSIGFNYFNWDRSGEGMSFKQRYLQMLLRMPVSSLSIEAKSLGIRIKGQPTKTSFIRNIMSLDEALFRERVKFHLFKLNPNQQGHNSPAETSFQTQTNLQKVHQSATLPTFHQSSIVPTFHQSPTIPNTYSQQFLFVAKHHEKINHLFQNNFFSTIPSTNTTNLINAPIQNNNSISINSSTSTHLQDQLSFPHLLFRAQQEIVLDSSDIVFQFQQLKSSLLQGLLSQNQPKNIQKVLKKIMVQYKFKKSKIVELQISQYQKQAKYLTEIHSFQRQMNFQEQIVQDSLLELLKQIKMLNLMNLQKKIERFLKNICKRHKLYKMILKRQKIQVVFILFQKLMKQIRNKSIKLEIYGLEIIQLLQIFIEKEDIWNGETLSNNQLKQVKVMHRNIFQILIKIQQYCISVSINTYEALIKQVNLLWCKQILKIHLKQKVESESFYLMQYEESFKNAEINVYGSVSQRNMNQFIQKIEDNHTFKNICAFIEQISDHLFSQNNEAMLKSLNFNRMDQVQQFLYRFLLTFKDWKISPTVLQKLINLLNDAAKCIPEMEETEEIFDSEIKILLSERLIREVVQILHKNKELDGKQTIQLILLFDKKWNYLIDPFKRQKFDLTPLLVEVASKYQLKVHQIKCEQPQKQPQLLRQNEKEQIQK